MLAVPQNLLKNFICAQCNGYLNCKPILLQPNGNNICGNCVQQNRHENQGTRNTAFESIAKNVLIFPCRYKEKGCKYELKFNIINIHETGCIFRIYNCPVQRLENCSWVGSISELEEHFKNYHSTVFLTNPGKIVIRLKKSTEQLFLLTLLKFLFIVQVNYDSTSQKILYCVRFVGSSLLTKPFEYVIRMGTESQNLWKKCTVEPYDNDNLDNCKYVDIDKLTINDITEAIEAEIEVYLKDNKCCSCNEINLKDLVLERNGYMCNDCLTLIPCPNAKSGCIKIEQKINIKKHQKLFCKYTKEPCFLDDCKYICKNMNLMQHLITCHYLPKFELQSNIYIYKSNTKYVESIKNQNCCFLFFINFTNDNVVHVRLLTNGTKNSIVRNTIVLKFINQLTSQFIEKEMLLDCHAELYDWYLDFEDNGEQHFFYDLEENGVKRRHCSLQIFIHYWQV